MAIEVEARERLAVECREIIARYPQPRSALLPMLHLVQSEEGYVSPDGIALCAQLLDLTTAEVAAVATFYTQYKRHPNGTYTVGVCTNTLCAIMGGDQIFATLEEHLGIGHDETTADGAITLERVECNAACDYAPVVMVNWEFFDNQTPSTATGLVDALRAGEDVVPTRGAAKVCTFKEVSRVLAGFSDGRAGEGVAAGEASLRGTRLARERGWTAPQPQRPGRREEPAAGAEAAGRTAAGAAVGSSSNDAPVVPASAKRRGSATAGKPTGEATGARNGSGSGTEPPAGSGSESKEG
jgi:NADH-quinone oxidoreductase subunit E